MLSLLNQDVDSTRGPSPWFQRRQLSKTCYWTSGPIFASTTSKTRVKWSQGGPFTWCSRNIWGSTPNAESLSRKRQRRRRQPHRKTSNRRRRHSFILCSNGQNSHNIFWWPAAGKKKLDIVALAARVRHIRRHFHIVCLLFIRLFRI